jgi:hypothetical protein
MILWLAIVMLLQVLKRYIQSAGQLCQDFFRSGAKPIQRSELQSNLDSWLNSDKGWNFSKQDDFQMTTYSPHHPRVLSPMRTELVWDGKYDEFGNQREVDMAGIAVLWR